MSIYKPCDIRGSAESELTSELYRSWGRVLGERVVAGDLVVAGGDVRGSTPAFLAALVEGLCSTGVAVIDLGQLPTPMVYFCKRQLQASACAIVTASHNPADINGLKWMLGEMPPRPEEVDALRRGAEAGTCRQCETIAAQPRRLDIAADYIEWLKNSFPASAAEMRIVLDPMAGCWAERAENYMKAVFPRVEITAINNRSQGDFAGRTPDSAQPRLLGELCAETKRQKADLGIAFDGDGDRVSFVDGDGSPLGPEQTTQIFLDSFGGELSGKSFVYDLKFSQKVADKAKACGAEPLVERSGHAFIRRRMLETAAPFGAETSGHYFFGRLQGGDDGLYAACWMIEYLARRGRSLADLQRSCPPVYLTPDLRVRVSPDARDEVIAHVAKAWSDYPQSTVDGVRVVFPDGWALVRGSVTEPALTFRFEGDSSEKLNDIVGRYCGALAGLKSLPDLKDTLWNKFQKR